MPADMQAQVQGAVDPREAAQFAAIAESWWDPDGPFRPLHRLNPTRMRFVMNAAQDNFGIAEGARRRTGMTAVDVGCGGGLISEPLARLGAAVTGLDVTEENLGVARAHAASHGCGAQVVVLVASVFRKTSYKRRPARLYGADDYVELHHLGDMLPEKLARHLQIDVPSDAAAEDQATEAVYEIADARMEDQSSDELASLIVADVVRYNGDRIADTSTVSEARAALSEDLEVACDLLKQVYTARGDAVDASAALERSFRALMHTMGRREARA